MCRWGWKEFTRPFLAYFFGMKRLVMAGVLILALSLVLISLASSKEETAFVEPTGEEWARMSATERAIAQQKLERELTRQRAASTRYAEDQKEGVCHVHRTKMTLRTVEVPHGMPETTGRSIIPRAVMGKYLVAFADRFPNAIETVPGSCVVLPNAATTEQLYVCPSCLTARQKAEAELGIVRDPGK